MRYWMVSILVGCTGDDNVDTKVDPPPPVVTPYEELPIKRNFQLTTVDYEGMAIQYYVPDDPVAALWVFHGTDGGFETVTQVEWVELYNRLAPYGVAIILNQSIDRDVKQWDTSTDNPQANVDFVRLASVRDFLTTTSALTTDTPVLAAGFSQGGGFTSLFANMAVKEGWDMRTFVVHNSGSYFGEGVPGMFISAENDPENGSPERVGEAADACTAAAGVTCPHVYGTEIPLDPRRFARLEAYTIEQSQSAFDELVDFAYVDAQGIRLVDNVETEIESLMNDYIAMSRMPSPSLPPTQIRVVWATHRMSSQHVDEEATHLLDSL